MNGQLSTHWSASLQLGLMYHREGRLIEAEALYQRVLEHEPRQHDALRFLGVLARQRGEFDRARELFELALEAKPDSAETHHDLGLVWSESSRPQEAIAAFHQALTIQPQFPEAHYNLGNVYYATGDRERAAGNYRKALEQQPDLAEAHYNLGLLRQENREHAAAIDCYQQALSHRPNYPEALLNSGLCQKELGDLVLSAASYSKALEYKTDYPEGWLNLGIVQHQRGQLAEAEECFRRTLSLQPTQFLAHLNLAMVLDDLRRYEEAVSQAHTAVSMSPDNPQVHAYLGALLIKQNSLEEATVCSYRALQLNRSFVPAHVNLAEILLVQSKLEEAAERSEIILELDSLNVAALVCLGVVRSRQRRPFEAITHLKKALVSNPTHPDALINLGICELLVGNFRDGWNHYEARWRSKLTCCSPRLFSQPGWQGEDPQGRTLLIYAEQGFGDTIQFVRYAPLLVQRGAKVILECQPALKSLMQTIEGVTSVLSYGETLPPFDFHVPLLSLPGIFQTTLETIPRQTPYLRASSGTQLDRDDIAGNPFKIGLVWRGSRSQNNDQRPVPLECLFPLLALEGIAFFSLQIAALTDELEKARRVGRIVDISSMLTDFAASAAVIQQLDLVISIDTAVAHLAGALGKPVWVLLPFAPDWRWMLERDDNPWYPTMRLFRQTRYGDWSEAIEQIVSELKTHNSQKRIALPVLQGS